MICLDTNVVVAAMNERFRNVRARLEQTLIDDIVVGVPTIVLYELWYGIKKSVRRDANAAALSTFLALDVTPWPFEIARRRGGGRYSRRVGAHRQTDRSL